MLVNYDTLLQQRFVKWAHFIGWLILLLGVLVLSDWQFDIHFFRRPVNGLVAMNPVTAFCFCCSATSFLLITNKKATKLKRVTGYILATVVIVIGVLKLGGVILNTAWQIDNLIYTGRILEDMARNMPSQMAANTALCFMLSGCCLLLFHYPPKNEKVLYQYPALLIVLLAFFSCVSYLYRVPEFYTWLSYLPMAIHTAIGFVCVGLMLIMAQPTKGIGKTLTVNLGGSIMARLLIPATLLIPVLLGAIRLIINSLAPVSTELGVTMLIMATVIIFTGLMWHNIKLINKRDLQQKKTEQKFKGLLEAAPDAVIIADGTGVIQLVNAQTEKVFGYDRVEIIGQRIEFLMPERYRKAHLGHRNDYFLNPKSRGMGEGLELFGRKKDGSEFLIEISLSPMQTEEGLLISAAIRDITERKKAEEKFKSLLEAAPDAMVIVGEKGIIELVNAQAEKMFGYRRHELIGQEVELLLPERYRNTHKGHRDGYFANPRLRGMGAGLELFGRKKDGTEFFIEISLSPLQTEEGTLVSAAIRDITDRKKEEEKFKGLLEAAPDAMIIADEKGVIQLVNAQAERVFGYDRTEIIGQQIEFLLPHRYRETHQGHRNSYFSNPRVRGMGAGLELFGRKKDGSEFFVEISLSPLETKEGILVSASIRDITERKKLEERLKQFNKELEQEVKLKTAELVDMLDRISDSFLALDKNLNYTYLNKKMVAAIGKDVSSLLGKPVWDVFPGAADSPTFQAVQKAMKEQSYVTNEYFDKVQERWYENHIYPSPQGLSVFIRDVTERKKVEEQQNQLAAIVNSTDVAIISKTLDGIITTWNHGAEVLFGFTADETIGRHVSLVFSNDLSNEESYIAKKIRKGEYVDEYETDRMRKDGSIISISLTVYPVRSQDGEIIASSQIARNITERKKAEAKIREAEKRYQVTLDSMIEGCQIIDYNWRYVYINPVAAKQGRNDPGRLLGRSMMEAYPGIEQTTLFSILRKCMENRTTEQVENEFIYGDDSSAWFELRIQPSAEGLFILSIDITERKKSEAKILALNGELVKSEQIYKTIASSIPGSLIILFDNEHRYLLIAGDLMPRFGYTNEQLMGKKAKEVLPVEVYDEFRHSIERVFNGESFSTESRNHDLDTLTRFIPIRNEANEIIMAMLVIIDVTELKNIQRELSDLNRDLEQKVADRTEQLAMVNSELEAFTYSVSHDLRAPLRIIDGFADILVADHGNKLDVEGNRTLGVIKSNAQRMGQLIDDLLNLSRLGRKELVMTKVNMNSLVHAVIEEQQALDNFQVAIACEKLLPAWCDSSLFRQVWGNLISNAVKYSSKKIHPEITIGSYEKEKEIIYFIKDNGVGFNMQYAGKLFGVFQRLHKQTEFEGTGVGLALVQRILTKHAGKIWVEAEQDKGATFFFSLPVAVQKQNYI